MVKAVLTNRHGKSTDLSHNPRTGLQQPYYILWISLRFTRKLHSCSNCPLFPFGVAVRPGKLSK